MLSSAAHGFGKRVKSAPTNVISRSLTLSRSRLTLLLPLKLGSPNPMPKNSLVSNPQPYNMAATQTFFLFDVDNTLLNNDRVTADLKRHLDTEVGHDRAQRYWEFFENIRSELGYADYLGALQRYRIEYPRDPRLLAVSYFLMRYPFANRLFPGSIDAVEYVAKFGPVVILSDGDVVFQPHKVYRSGLYESFNG